MLVHHSRNSEQKQWDETLVLSLSGMGRLLRVHLPLITPMEAFPQVGSWPNHRQLPCGTTTCSCWKAGSLNMLRQCMLPSVPSADSAEAAGTHCLRSDPCCC